MTDSRKIIKLKLVEPIEGFDTEVEYRPAQDDEEFLSANGTVTKMHSDLTRNAVRLVLKDVRAWVDATIEDGIAAIENPVIAKFKDKNYLSWTRGKLCGVANYNGSKLFIDEGGDLYEECKIQKLSEEKDIT